MLKNPSNFVPLAPKERTRKERSQGCLPAAGGRVEPQPAAFEELAQAFGVPEGKVVLLYGDKALFKLERGAFSLIKHGLLQREFSI